MYIYIYTQRERERVVSTALYSLIQPYVAILNGLYSPIVCYIALKKALL